MQYHFCENHLGSLWRFEWKSFIVGNFTSFDSPEVEAL